MGKRKIDLKGNEYFDYSANERGCNFFVKGGWQKSFVDMIFDLRFNMNRVLDVGCAAGALASTMADKGSHVVGCDISQYMTGESPFNKKNGGNVDLYATPATSLKMIPNLYDFILCTEVVGHIPPAQSSRVAKEFYKKLDKDGVVWLTFEICKEEDMEAHGPLDERDDVTHINLRSQAYWLKQFADAGFERLDYMEELNKQMEFYKMYNWNLLIFRK